MNKLYYVKIGESFTLMGAMQASNTYWVKIGEKYDFYGFHVGCTCVLVDEETRDVLDVKTFPMDLKVRR